MSFTHDHSCKLEASRADVFAALTGNEALQRWFAEHTDVSDHPGGAFAFWGRHSLETPTRAAATQEITQWEQDTALAFTWSLAGVPTEVVFALATEDEGCRLTLSHAVHGTLPFPRERALVDDHWRLAMGNLQAHLAGDDAVARPDFTDPSPEVRQVIFIDALREVVFRTLITPHLVNEWFGATAAEIEPVVGGRYTLGWSYQVDSADVTGGPTRILEYVENERLVLDWPDWRGDPEVPLQRIAFELASEGERTRLTFVHSGFVRAVDVSDYPFGWAWFLSQLQLVALAHSKASESAG